jgi:hypothetical protein
LEAAMTSGCELFSHTFATAGAGIFYEPFHSDEDLAACRKFGRNLEGGATDTAS